MTMHRTHIYRFHAIHHPAQKKRIENRRHHSAEKRQRCYHGKKDDDETVDDALAKDQRTSASQKALTNNVSFALVNPQGPMNVGSCEGLTWNSRPENVRGSAFVFDPADDDEEEEEEEEEETQKQKEKGRRLRRKE